MFNIPKHLCSISFQIFIQAKNNFMEWNESNAFGIIFTFLRIIKYTLTHKLILK